MAKHKVLRSFPYADDGLATRDVAVGEEIEVRPDLVGGLVAAGYIANAAAAETASKIAGETIAQADLTGQVDDAEAVSSAMADAKSRISDGKIGEPEARQIVDEHKLIPTLGDGGENQGGAESTSGVEAFDHDGDGKPGGAPKGGNRKKSQD